MTETNQNFDHWRGDAREITIPCVDAAGATIDLTDSTVRWRAFSLAEVAVILKATSLSTVSLVRVNGPSGELDAIRFTIQPADTLSLAPGIYRHEAETIDVLGNVSTVLEGKMALKRDRVI